ncbi:MAG: hypothetical protein ACI8P9_002588 [Parasphingorhabdus sp.]
MNTWGRKLQKLVFSKEEKNQIIVKTQAYFCDELDQEIGDFDAEFLIDFFGNEIGAYFYNLGLRDAQALISSKIDELSDSVFDLQQPTQFQK